MLFKIYYVVLSYGAESNMANILRVSYILYTYLNITAKYKKRVKDLHILNESNVNKFQNNYLFFSKQLTFDCLCQIAHLINFYKQPDVIMRVSYYGVLSGKVSLIFVRTFDFSLRELAFLAFY